jgi:hypothetical protein
MDRLRPEVTVPQRRGRPFLFAGVVALLFAAGASQLLLHRCNHRMRGVAHLASGPAAPVLAPRTVRVHVTSDPPGATVEHEYGQMCTTPCTLELSATTRPEMLHLVHAGFEGETIELGRVQDDRELHAHLRPLE